MSHVSSAVSTFRTSILSGVQFVKQSSTPVQVAVVSGVAVVGLTAIGLTAALFVKLGKAAFSKKAEPVKVPTKDEIVTAQARVDGVITPAKATAADLRNPIEEAVSDAAVASEKAIADAKTAFEAAEANLTALQADKASKKSDVKAAKNTVVETRNNWSKAVTDAEAPFAAYATKVTEAKTQQDADDVAAAEKKAHDDAIAANHKTISEAAVKFEKFKKFFRELAVDKHPAGTADAIAAANTAYNGAHTALQKARIEAAAAGDAATDEQKAAVTTALAQTVEAAKGLNTVVDTHSQAVTQAHLAIAVAKDAELESNVTVAQSKANTAKAEHEKTAADRDTKAKAAGVAGTVGVGTLAIGGLALGPIGVAIGALGGAAYLAKEAFSAHTETVAKEQVATTHTAEVQKHAAALTEHRNKHRHLLPHLRQNNVAGV